ncbi:hypothetical protein QVD99_006007 [Batrachochytrium dendrobatidis]|nr:hypothetical protein O5D80_006195 [Batrachochytrium dendrobatidis]KAK5667407.1 hypothetical protein QVD99_006007 [Batrachochytrium dendrobatidis]
MGHVTVLVQHAWAMQSMAAAKKPNQHGADKRKPITQNTNLKKNQSVNASTMPIPKTLAQITSRKVLPSQIRVTVPSSVAQLVNMYNSSQTVAQRQTCQATACDILARLEHLVLASIIHDPFRKDMVRSSIYPVLDSASTGVFTKAAGAHRQKPLKSLGQAALANSHPSTLSAVFSSPIIDPVFKPHHDSKFIGNSNSSASKTTQFASEARLSVLMLSQCRTRHIRDRAMDLLMESLDTNILSTHMEETICLQHLWIELVHVLRHTIDGRRRHRAVSGGISIAAELNKHHSMSNPIQHKSTDVPRGGSLANPTNNQAALKRVNYDRSVSELVENVLDTQVLVDDHLERILSCLLLTMHRIEYARDVCHVELISAMDQSFYLLLEDLELVRSENPYIIQLIGDIQDSVHYIISMGEEKEEVMAFPVGISLLSQIVRTVVPENLSTLYESFQSIMSDLSHKRQWHIGRKFIRILASAGMLKLEVCLMFIRFVKELQVYNWQWQFLGVLCLGNIACSSESSAIRRTAIEDGLLYYTEIGLANDMLQTETSCTDHANHQASNPLLASNQDTNSIDKTHEVRLTSQNDTWKIRAASIVALTEIYQQYRSQPHGLLAREVIGNCRAREPNPNIQHLLNHPAAIAPQTRMIRRLSFVFKYICMSLAEIYADTQSDYSYLRKYVQTAERNESRRRWHPPKTGMHDRSNDRLGQDGSAIDNESHHGKLEHMKPIKTKKDMAREVNVPFQSHLAGSYQTNHSIQEAVQLSTRNMTNRKEKPQFAGRDPELLSINPYHENYKQIQIDSTASLDDAFLSFEECNRFDSPVDGIPTLAQLPPLAPSTFHSYLSGFHPRQSNSLILDNGTANRRKLFNVNRPDSDSSPGPDSEHKHSQKESIKNQKSKMDDCHCIAE